LPDVRRFWLAGRHSPLFWLTALVVAYIAGHAIIASIAQPAWASYHRKDAIALIYLCGFILSGFSFELTHAYAANPVIEERGTRISCHTPTEISVLKCLSSRYGNIFTTEPTVNREADVPMLGAG